MKPGWKTTEFWLTVIANVAGAVVASGALAEGGIAERVVGIGLMALSAMGYSVSRGLAKGGGK